MKNSVFVALALMVALLLAGCAAQGSIDGGGNHTNLPNQTNASGGPNDTNGTVGGPTLCYDLWMPVCGSDGKTYANKCWAGAAKVSTAYEGECASANSTVLDAHSCEAAHGHWVGCQMACTDSIPGSCTTACLNQCNCGGIAGWSCPEGYSCQDMKPSPQTPDAMGTCKRIGVDSQTRAQTVARQFVVGQSPTFLLDGSNWSSDFVQLASNGTHLEPMMGRPCQMGQECWQPCSPQACWTFTYEFSSELSGYGNSTSRQTGYDNRTQVVRWGSVPHQMVIWVDPSKMAVVHAVTDGVFDEIGGQYVQWSGNWTAPSKSSDGTTGTTPLTDASCQAGGGYSTSGSDCRGAPADEACDAGARWYCECGGYGQWTCPRGHACTDYLPSIDTPNAIGRCN